MSFSRKFSQSLSADASSTMICRLSSESLKTMYLYFLLSLRSLKAVTHSGATEALQRRGQYRLLGQPPPAMVAPRSASIVRGGEGEQAVRKGNDRVGWFRLTLIETAKVRRND